MEVSDCLYKMNIHEGKEPDDWMTGVKRRRRVIPLLCWSRKNIELCRFEIPPQSFACKWNIYFSTHTCGLFPSVFTSVGWFQVSSSTEARVLTWSFSSWSFLSLWGSTHSSELLRFQRLQHVPIKSLQAYFYICWHFWFNFLWTLKECAARWDVRTCTCAGVHVSPPTHRQRWLGHCCLHCINWQDSNYPQGL